MSLLSHRSIRIESLGGRKTFMCKKSEVENAKMRKQQPGAHDEALG
jgi:hypothetical protein